MARSVFLGLLSLAILAGGSMASAAELQPKTSAFLRELGVDPGSTSVMAVSGDVVAGKYSLDLLAAKRDEDGVKSFIATRNFIRAYMQDTKTPFPDDELYLIRFLKPDETQFISKALMAAPH